MIEAAALPSLPEGADPEDYRDTLAAGRSEVSEGDPFDEEDGGPWPIHGIALPLGVVVTGGAGEPTVWTPDVLEDAAEARYLDGEHLVARRGSHEGDEAPGVEHVVGEVLASEFVEDEGLGYTGELDDRKIAQGVERGRFDVSPRLYRTLSEETREIDGESGSVADQILEIESLAVVRHGAGGEAVDARPGPHPEISPETADALSAAFGLEARYSTDLDGDSTMSNTDTEEVEQLRKENRELRSQIRQQEAEDDELAFAYAESLADSSAFSASELVDRFEFRELREKVEEPSKVVDTLTPNPRTGDPDPAGEAGGSGGAETLSAEDEETIETLEARREYLEGHVSEDHLEALDAEIDSIKENGSEN